MIIHVICRFATGFGLKSYFLIVLATCVANLFVYTLKLKSIPGDEAFWPVSKRECASCVLLPKAGPGK
jgi:hypothetical protein